MRRKISRDLAIGARSSPSSRRNSEGRRSHRVQVHNSRSPTREGVAGNSEICAPERCCCRASAVDKIASTDVQRRT